MRDSLATPKQLTFIATLMAERDLSQFGPINTGALSVRQASEAITALMTLPRKPRVQATTEGQQARELLEKIPNSKYALATDVLRQFLVATDLGKNSLLFVEVRTYKEHKYVRRLHGGGESGDFTRSRLDARDGVAILARIAEDPAAAALAFSQAYTCCAVCLRPLTDEVSRTLGLGPVCRLRFA